MHSSKHASVRQLGFIGIFLAAAFEKNQIKYAFISIKDWKIL